MHSELMSNVLKLHPSGLFIKLGFVLSRMMTPVVLFTLDLSIGYFCSMQNSLFRGRGQRFWDMGKPYSWVFSKIMKQLHLPRTFVLGSFLALPNKQRQGILEQSHVICISCGLKCRKGVDCPLFHR